MTIWKYIKAAFRNRWNLLGLFGGISFSLLSGRPDIGLPLVAAAEIAWLGFVGTHPRFQNYVDVLESQKRQLEESLSAEQRMNKMLKSLPRGAQQRFKQLMSRCEELRRIASQFQAAQGAAADDILDDVRLAGLDRLLWLYLKLLYTEHSLNRFFETTSIDEIDQEIRLVRQRLEREESRPQNPQRDRIIATLKDNLKTCEDRKRNFQQARDSYELVRAEQKRLENKIRSIAEMGISQGDPVSLSSQVDAAAGSIQETEKTLGELNFITGLTSEEDEKIPQIVTRTTITG